MEPPKKERFHPIPLLLRATVCCSPGKMVLISTVFYCFHISFPFSRSDASSIMPREKNLEEDLLWSFELLIVVFVPLSSLISHQTAFHPFASLRAHICSSVRANVHTFGWNRCTMGWICMKSTSSYHGQKVLLAKYSTRRFYSNSTQCACCPINWSVWLSPALSVPTYASFGWRNKRSCNPATFSSHYRHHSCCVILYVLFTIDVKHDRSLK